MSAAAEKSEATSAYVRWPERDEGAQTVKSITGSDCLRRIARSTSQSAAPGSSPPVARVKPLRGVGFLPRLDRGCVSDSGRAAAPGAACAPRGREKRRPGGRDVPHMFPAPALRGRASEPDRPA
jgi:hypothetical protein